MTISSKTVRFLLAAVVVTNPLTCVFLVLGLHALVIYFVGRLALDACRNQWTIQVQQPKPTAVTVHAQNTVTKDVVTPNHHLTCEQGKVEAVAAVRQASRRMRTELRASVPAPSHARIVPAPKPKKGRVPSAKRLQAMTIPELVQVGRDRGCKGLSPKMTRDTLVRRITAPAVEGPTSRSSR